MSTQVQFRRGNTAQTSTFTGASAEITVDTDKKTIVVHDGSTAGGFALARENSSNTAGSYANSAYATANSAQSYANSAFIVANNSLGIDTTQNTNITNAGTYANSAFLAANTPSHVANSAASYANSAFIVANNSLGIDTTQNTNISSAASYANSAFIVANNSLGIDTTQNTNITNVGTYANSAFLAANTPSNVANSAASYANSAFLRANTPTHVANSAASYANSAYTRANNSVNANTGGIITGDITITGNLIIQGNTFTANAGILTSNDTLFLLGTGNYTADALDVGFASHYNAGTNAHTGFIRDVGTKEWYIFKNYTPEVGANNNININDPSFTIDTLNANLKSTIITLKGIDLLPYVNNAYTAANTADTKAVNSGTYANAAFLVANTPTHVANSAASYANSAFASANLISGVNTTQNTNITNAGTYANAAFAQANTDFTNISISPSQTYGNSGYYPVITISANGRINAVSTQVVTDPSAIAFAIALG